MSRPGPVRVLVVEDSPVCRQLLLHILGSDPGIRVVGTAADGRDALEQVRRLQPEVVTMDVRMPGMDGLEATRRIMAQHPLPIVIVSGTVQRHEIATTFAALQAGAVAAIPRPAGPGDPRHGATARELIRTVKAMAEVRLVRRRVSPEEPSGGSPPSPPPAAKPLLVAIGASTGGPEALRQLLADLPGDFPLPVVAVQHMAAGFLGGLAEWLDRATPLTVLLGREGAPVEAGQVVIAPDDRHLEIGPGLRAALSTAPPEKGVRPAVGRLFRSVLAVCGARAVEVLLTGMGDDGVAEMKQLRERGGVTIAQDRDSSVIYGMPGEAARTGAALYQLPPAGIARLLRQLAAGRQRGTVE